MPNYTYTRDIPDGPNNPSADQPIMKTNANSTDSILNIDLYGFNDNNGGFHQKSTYVVQGSDPVPLNTDGAQGIVYSKTASGIAEIFVNRFGSATPVQLTRGAISVSGNANSAGSTGYTFLPGGILIQWGTVTATTSGAAITFPVTFTTIYSITNSVHSAPAIASSVANVTNSGATAVSASGTPIFNWIAIGV